MGKFSPFQRPKWAYPGVQARLTFEGRRYVVRLEASEDDGRLVFQHPVMPSLWLGADAWWPHLRPVEATT